MVSDQSEITVDTGLAPVDGTGLAASAAGHARQGWTSAATETFLSQAAGVK
jgi:hypothetical protein